MEDHSTSRTPNANRLLEFLKEAYTKDDEVERIPLDKCGWRSLGEIAAGTGLPTRRLYGKKPGDSGVELKQLVKDRLIEVRYFKGERGRGGEVTRFRIVISRNQGQRKLSSGKVVAKGELESDSAEITGLDKKRIAVLPFANISPDPKDEYFADGMTEELISTLSKIRGLKVISRTSVLRYKQTNKSLSEIAKELNVGAVLEGSVRKAADDLRITAQLIDVQNDEHLWSEDYDRKFENIFSLQKEIAQQVANSLKLSILSKESKEIGKSPTQNLEAYTLYLKGRNFRHQWTLDSFNKTIEYCKLAIEKDPDFARAFAEVARCYVLIGATGLIPENEAFHKGEEFADKAIRLDDSVPESHLAIGIVKLFSAWNFRVAETECRRALDLNPSLVDGHIQLSWVLAITRRFDESALEAKQALELDPLSTSTCTFSGLSFTYCRRWDDAIEAFGNALELAPNTVLARDNLGIAYVGKGKLDEGISEIRKAIDISGEHVGVYQWNDLAYAYSEAGKIEEARKVLSDLIGKGAVISETAVAGIYTSLGEYDKSLEYLERAYEKHDSFLTQINGDLTFEKLRPDPRFQSLLKKIGFPDAG